MVWFPGEDDTDADFADKDLADISKTDAVFIKIAFNADRDESPWAEDSVVPTSKLLSDNPSRDFGVKVGQSTVLVCDWHGNEYYRMTRTPKADALRKYLEKVSSEVEDSNEKLQKYLDKAQSDLNEGDRRGALKNLLKNFDDGDGPVGLAAQEESIRLYHEILDGAREQLEELKEKGDVDGLKELEKELKKTDLESDIEEAINALK